MPKTLSISLTLLFATLTTAITAETQTNAIVNISASGAPTTSGTVAISFADSAGKTYQELVPYGPSSTPGDIASAFGAGFTADYVCVAVADCKSGLGAVGAAGPNNTGTVTFQLNGSTSFGAINVSPSPFNVTTSNWPSFATSISINSSPTTALRGGNVALTATLNSNLVTGTVVFYSGGTIIGRSTVSSGIAVLSISTLITGTNSIQAVYSGDSTYLPSTSASITEIILAAAPTITGLSFDPTVPASDSSPALQGPPLVGFVVDGANFGPNDAPADTFVTVNGIEMTTNSWSDNQIFVQVPIGTAATGAAAVSVSVQGIVVRGPATFQVVPALGCSVP